MYYPFPGELRKGTITLLYGSHGSGKTTCVKEWLNAWGEVGCLCSYHGLDPVGLSKTVYYNRIFFHTTTEEEFIVLDGSLFDMESTQQLVIVFDQRCILVDLSDRYAKYSDAVLRLDQRMLSVEKDRYGMYASLYSGAPNAEDHRGQVWNPYTQRWSWF